MKYTKRILSLLLSALLILQIGIFAFAETDNEPYYSYTVIDEENKLACLYGVKEQDYTGKDLVIPKEVDGYKIVDIHYEQNSDGGRFLLKDSKYEDTVKSIVIEAELTDYISSRYQDSLLYSEGGECDPLFSRFSNLESVVLPDSLRCIDYRAFYNCKNLKSVKLPESLDDISGDAFKNCTSLTEIILNDNLKSIESNAFENCTSLKEITLNDNLESIGGGAFANCVNLKSIDGDADSKIEFNNGLESILSLAFENCESLKGKVYLGKNVSKVSGGAFAGCPGITGFRIDKNNEYLSEKSGVLYNKDKTQLLNYLPAKITKTWTVPSSVKDIDMYSFKGTKYLKKITIPSSITSLDSNTFEDSGIESIVAKGVTYIDYGVFENCTNLKKFEFSPKLSRIDWWAFSGCKNLSGKFKIGKNLELVGAGAFSGCDNLTGFIVEKGNKYFSQKSGVLYNADKTKLISYLPRKATEKFKIPATVKEIYEYAFATAKHLKEVTITSKITEIPEYCFANSSISSIKFEPSKNSLEIRKYAFVSCDNLKSLTLSERVTDVYNQTFYDCKNLKKITFISKDAWISPVYDGDDVDLADDTRIANKENLVICAPAKAKNVSRWANELGVKFQAI